MTAAPEIQSKSETLLSTREALAQAVATRTAAREALELGKAAANRGRQTVREAEEQLRRHKQALQVEQARRAQQMAEQVRQGLPAGEIESEEDALSEGCRAAEKLLEGYQRMTAELDAETAELQSVADESDRAVGAAIRGVEERVCLVSTDSVAFHRCIRAGQIIQFE